MADGILSEMTVDEVRSFRPEVVVLGVASTEPHGPALAYGSDFYQCDHLCRNAVKRANQKGARVLMYPTLPIGNNVNFKVFPFACRIGVPTLMRMLLDILQALEEDGIRKVALVDGHGGNTAAIQAALRYHFDITPTERRAFVCYVKGWMASEEAEALVERPSDHGGESEVSRNLYINPQFVRKDKLMDQPANEPLLSMLKDPDFYCVHPWHKRYPLSGGGNTRAA
ncbi:MAG: creatininase family protein, partial [Planctomycetota bacterium]